MKGVAKIDTVGEEQRFATRTLLIRFYWRLHLPTKEPNGTLRVTR